MEEKKQSNYIDIKGRKIYIGDTVTGYINNVKKIYKVVMYKNRIILVDDENNDFCLLSFLTNLEKIEKGGK